MSAKTRKLVALTAAAAISLALAVAPALQAAPQTESQPSGAPTVAPAGKSIKNRAITDQEQAPDGLPHRHRVNKMQRQAEQGAMPTMPGQDAFGAIAEIVRTLEADSNTDWSKVDLEALRQHLIDMNDVTLNAVAVAKPIEGGLEIMVTGTGRTVGAIQRMVPAHAKEIDGLNGWSVRAQPLPKGALLKVTSGDANEVKHIRGLGFIGIMVSGSHHPMHHLAMAKGESPHKH